MQTKTPPIVEFAADLSSREKTLGRGIAQLLALASISLGMAVGASWWFGNVQALAFGTQNVPMAPSTAFLFVVLGASLFVSSRWPTAPVSRTFNTGCLSVVAFISLLLGAQSVTGDASLERLIVGELSTPTGIPVGVMSPITSIAFLLASIALSCQWLALRSAQRADQSSDQASVQSSAINCGPLCLFISVALSWGIFVISEVTLTGYLSGLPPVLGNSKIPPAILTALAFMLASVAILLPSLTQLRLIHLPAGSKTRETIWRVIAVAVIGVAVAVALRLVIVGEDSRDLLPYVVFYPSVLIIALFTGLAGGLLATLLSGIYVQVWLHGGTLTGTEWIALTVFLVGSTITSLICEAMRQSRARERRAGIQLELALAEQARAAEALRESERRFRSIFQQAAVGVVRLAADGTWLEVNDKLCEIVGYPPEELLLKTFQDITHPDDSQADSGYLDQLLEGKTNTYSMEKRCYRKTGEMVWINLTASLVRDNKGDPGFFISIIEDISERKRAEIALRNSEEKFRALFEQAGGYCMVLDPNTSDGIPIIVDANAAACVMHGYEREEFIGRPVSDINDQAGKRLVKDRTAEIMTGKLFSVENTHVRKDGTTFTVSVNAKRIDIGGEPPLILTTEYDITEREELHHRIEKIAAHVPGMIFQYQQWPDGHAAFPYSSAGIRDIYGIDPDEVSLDATAVFDVLHPDDRSRVEAKMAESMHHLTIWNDSYRVRFSEHRVIWVEGAASPKLQPDGSVLWHGYIRDVTDRKQAEEQLRLAASVFEHSFEAVLITDAENRIIDTNPAFSAITGYDRASVLGKDPNILTSDRHDEAFYREMWDEIADQGSWQGEIWNRRKDGEMYAALLSISAVRHADQSVANYIAIFSDITERKEHEAELDHIANYDQLTGLPNRRLLLDRLDQASAQTRRSGRLFAVCYLDLDAFKPINDQHGHAVGDQVLIGIANQLRKVLRAQDTVARLGGDEFVLLLNDLRRLEDCYALLERVLAVCTSPVVLDGVTHRVSASIGVTLSSPDGSPDVLPNGDNADLLLRNADQAMYRAKEAGRNRYHLYDAEQDRQLQDRRLKLQDIEDALTSQEFVLYYQPKVDMVSREVIGVEALIRWQHPEDGLLLPGAFLPFIHGSNLEIAIGEWVITAALTQVAIWQQRGLKLPISVNISAGHLLAPSFTQRLGELLAEHPACDPGCLEMEIVETSALSDIVRAGQTLTACRAMGVSLALDDFGTGYSSLAYFRRLPIDVLKVDQSFVRDMLDDPEDMEIVESVVRLARAFNRLVIAEGVETPEHGALLTLLGCRNGQGFGIARPMPADEVPGWASTWPQQGVGMVVDPSIRRDDIPLAMAMQNHHIWVDEFVDAFNDADLSRLAQIEKTPCRLERWYERSGSRRFGQLEAFHTVGQSHAKLHQLASSILAFAEQSEMDRARLRLPSLLKARDELIDQLGAFIRAQTTLGA